MSPMFEKPSTQDSDNRSLQDLVLVFMLGAQKFGDQYIGWLSPIITLLTRTLGVVNRLKPKLLRVSSVARMPMQPPPDC